MTPQEIEALKDKLKSTVIVKEPSQNIEYLKEQLKQTAQPSQPSSIGAITGRDYSKAQRGFNADYIMNQLKSEPPLPEEGQTGFLGKFGSLFSGQDRKTAVTQALEDQFNQYGFFELQDQINDFMGGKANAARYEAETLTVFDPFEQAAIAQKINPDLDVRIDKDAQGNEFPILINSNTGQATMINNIGLDARDLTKAFGTGLLFLRGKKPSGSLPQRMLDQAKSGAVRQAAIEGQHALSGGEFNPLDVGLAGAGGAVGEIIAPAASSAFQGSKEGLKRAKDLIASFGRQSDDIVVEGAEQVARTPEEIIHIKAQEQAKGFQTDDMGNIIGSRQDQIDEALRAGDEQRLAKMIDADPQYFDDLQNLGITPEGVPTRASQSPQIVQTGEAFTKMIGSDTYEKAVNEHRQLQETANDILNRFGASDKASTDFELFEQGQQAIDDIKSTESALYKEIEKEIAKKLSNAGESKFGKKDWYHGGDYVDFDEFDLSMFGENYGTEGEPAIYHVLSKSEAEKYGRDTRRDKIDTSNYKELDVYEWVDEAYNSFREGDEGIEEWIESFDGGVMEASGFDYMVGSAAEEAKKEGYDGVIADFSKIPTDEAQEIEAIALSFDPKNINKKPTKKTVELNQVEGFINEIIGKSARGEKSLGKLEKEILSYINEGASYSDLDRLRKKVGAAAFEGKDIYPDATSAQLSKIYGLLTQDQEIAAGRLGLGEVWDNAKKLTQQRIDLQDRSKALFGKNLDDKGVTARLTKSMNALANGNPKDFNKLVKSLPSGSKANDELRQTAVMTAVKDVLKGGSTKAEGLSIGNFANWYNKLNSSPAYKSALYKQLPKEFRGQLDSLGRVATRLNNAMKSTPPTGMNLTSTAFLNKLINQTRNFLGKWISGMTSGAVDTSPASKSEPAKEAMDKAGAVLNNPNFLNLVKAAAQGKEEAVKVAEQKLMKTKAARDLAESLEESQRKALVNQGFMRWFESQYGEEMDQAEESLKP